VSSEYKESQLFHQAQSWLKNVMERMGEEVVLKEHRQVIVKHVDTRPEATFIFKYHSFGEALSL
jgi:NAD(P)H-nitrite reductase large subunit